MGTFLAKDQTVTHYVKDLGDEIAMQFINPAARTTAVYRIFDHPSHVAIALTAEVAIGLPKHLEDEFLHQLYGEAQAREDYLNPGSTA